MATRKKAAAKSAETGGKSLSKAEAQEKQALRTSEEQALPGTYFVPYADIYETAESLYVLMEMPGVQRDGIEIELDKDVLSVEGRLDFTNYANLRPVYTEYNVGHFSRRFRVPAAVDADDIKATLSDGVLTLELAKVDRAKLRRIAIE